MGYDGKIMRRAIQRFEEDRREREDRFQRRREGVFFREPRLREIDSALRSTMSRILSSALRQGTDPRLAVESLKRENLALQEEKRALLAALRLPEDCLEEVPACSLCGDTGYRNGQMCRCLRGYYAQEQQKELSRMLDLGGQSFETFRLDYYGEEPEPNLGVSPRENMDWVYRVCRKYAETFGKESGNLLLTGGPGLGKTFLSAAIAGAVSAAGWPVVYDSAADIFQHFERQKFDRDEESLLDVERVMGCSLLIIDDLGTEMATAFVQSALYQIVNGRLIRKMPTVISTNLPVGELGRRYSPQIASRLEGEYKILPFFGEDIRRKRK